MKKILFYSDNPLLESGFAQVAKNIIKALTAGGDYEIMVAGVGEMTPHAITPDWITRAAKNLTYTLYSVSQPGDPLGIRTAQELITKADYDILFTLGNTDALNALVPAVLTARKKRLISWVTYTPIDSDFYFEGYYECLTQADVPVVYTDWAKGVISKNKPTLEPRLEVIGHGCEPDVFKKLSAEERLYWRKTKFPNLPEDAFIVLNVNRNDWRKDWLATMQAFEVLAEANPKAYLYLHTNPIAHGCNLFAQSYKMKHRDRYVYTKMANASREELNGIYNAADVLISTSLGEGWGLSMTEAFAAGTPVVMPSNSVFPEIMGKDRGMMVGGGEWICSYGNDYAMRQRVDYQEMGEYLSDLSFAPQVYISEWIENAHRYAEENTWEKVGESWVKLFGEL